MSERPRSATEPVVHPATDQDFDEIVAESKVPVLVDFWAPWCGPCRVLSPIVAKLARRFAGRALVVKVDIDQSPDLADRFEITSIPTIVIIHEGRQERRVGCCPLAELAAWLQQVLDDGNAARGRATGGQR